METKICKKCGQMKPLNQFFSMERETAEGETKKYYRSLCCVCCGKGDHDLRSTIKVRDFKYKVERIYKDIHPSRILDLEVAKIAPMSHDEIFAQMMDAKRAWISNYGRCIVMEDDGRYQLLPGEGRGKNLCYKIVQNVFAGNICEEKQVKIIAEKAVVQNFIVNIDWKNNTKIWHAGNDEEDMYYRNLYPVNQKQYAAIMKIYRNTGFETEEDIMQICNDPQYFHDGFDIAKYTPTVRGKGYIGDSVNQSKDYAYGRWSAMLARCYDEAFPKRSVYEECEVAPEFLNYSNFKIWWDQHYYKIKDEAMHLDKDILCENNTLYAPERVCIIPERINYLFVKPKHSKANVPYGVHKERKTKKIKASMSIDNHTSALGRYDTMKEAFQAYKNKKEEIIQGIALELRGLLPYTVYERMMSYEVKPFCDEEPEVSEIKYIRKFRRRRKAKIDIPLISDRERFVPIKECPWYYISNFGRCVRKYKNGNFHLMKLDEKGKYHIVVNGKTKKVHAAKAVVAEFFADVEEFDYVWHTDNRKDDYYYKHLFPVTKEMYYKIRSFYEEHGYAGEYEIRKLIGSDIGRK